MNFKIVEEFTESYGTSKSITGLSVIVSLLVVHPSIMKISTENIGSGMLIISNNLKFKNLK